MRHCLFRQQAKAFNRVHKTLIFSVLWVSEFCYCLKGNSKPLFRYCTACEPSKSSACLSSTTDKNAMFRWLKPWGMLQSITNCCSNCCSGKALKWPSDTFRDIDQALEIKQTNLAPLNAEHWISYTHVSSGIRTSVNKAQKASGLSQQLFVNKRKEPATQLFKPEKHYIIARTPVFLKMSSPFSKLFAIDVYIHIIDSLINSERPKCIGTY